MLCGGVARQREGQSGRAAAAQRAKSPCSAARHTRSPARSTRARLHDAPRGRPVARHQRLLLALKPPGDHQAVPGHDVELVQQQHVRAWRRGGGVKGWAGDQHGQAQALLLVAGGQPAWSHQRSQVVSVALHCCLRGGIHPTLCRSPKCGAPLHPPRQAHPPGPPPTAPARTAGTGCATRASLRHSGVCRRARVAASGSAAWLCRPGPAAGAARGASGMHHGNASDGCGRTSWTSPQRRHELPMLPAADQRWRAPLAPGGGLGLSRSLAATRSTKGRPPSATTSASGGWGTQRQRRRGGRPWSPRASRARMGRALAPALPAPPSAPVLVSVIVAAASRCAAS